MTPERYKCGLSILLQVTAPPSPSCSLPASNPVVNLKQLLTATCNPEPLAAACVVSKTAREQGQGQDASFPRESARSCLVPQLTPSEACSQALPAVLYLPTAPCSIPHLLKVFHPNPLDLCPLLLPALKLPSAQLLRATPHGGGASSEHQCDWRRAHSFPKAPNQIFT